MPTFLAYRILYQILSNSFFEVILSVVNIMSLLAVFYTCFQLVYICDKTP